MIRFFGLLVAGALCASGAAFAQNPQAVIQTEAPGQTIVPPAPRMTEAQVKERCLAFFKDKVADSDASRPPIPI